MDLIACITSRAIDADGKSVGQSNPNPILDTRKYEVEFLDGSTETLMANIIAENLLSQIDDEGHRQLFMTETVDNCKLKNAVPVEDRVYTTPSGQK